MENTTKAIAPLSMTEISTMAQAFSKSGFFKDAADEAKAIVKIVYGRDLGVSPVAAMLGIYLTSQGKLELDSGLIASLIKESRRYSYRVLKLDHTACEIEFTDNGQVVGISRFDQADAQRAGLGGKDTYQKYPRNLYFARALTNGARWYCPNLFGGAVYARGEIDESNAPSEGELRAEIKEVTSETQQAELKVALDAPAPESEMKPTPSKENGTKVKQPIIRTAKWKDMIASAMSYEYIAGPNDAHRLVTVIAQAGFTEVTDKNADTVWQAISKHYEDKKAAAETFADESEAVMDEQLASVAAETSPAEPQRFDPPPLPPGFHKVEPGPVIPSLKEKDAPNPVRQADPITKEQRAALKRYFTGRANGNEDAALKEMHAKFVAKFGHTMYEATRIEAAKVLDEIEAADPF